MNLIHLVTVSYHHLCQDREFETQMSLLFLTFYVRATIDSDPPGGVLIVFLSAAWFEIFTRIEKIITYLT